MHFTPALATAILALSSSVSAHTWMSNVWKNGEDQGNGRGVYIRTPSSTDPVVDLKSKELACNDKGSTPVSKFLSFAPGDKCTFEWMWAKRGDMIIDPSHKGPITTWVAPYTDGDGSGAIWTKIDEFGWDGKKWGVEKLKDQQGKWDFTIPDLKAGKYLFRQEMIALHEGDGTLAEGRGAQFYPSCVQIEVTGSGTGVPDQKFDFNTGYTSNDPGILFNIYNGFSSYPIPGPKVWTGGSSGTPPTTPDPTPSTPSTPTQPQPTKSTEPQTPKPTKSTRPKRPENKEEDKPECGMGKRDSEDGIPRRSRDARRSALSDN